MKIAVTGSTSFIGKALVTYLKQQGNEVICLTRSATEATSPCVIWNPDKGQLDPFALEGCDAVINLSGENIANGRWNAKKKQKIHDSRVNSTRLLCQTLSHLQSKPKVFINASAIGYYGDTGDHAVDESSTAGSGFLAKVCQDWELAALQAEKEGIRTVLLRIGIVLSVNGGALAMMLIPFKYGLGGMIGSGNQFMSWIVLDDLLKLVDFTLNDETTRGPVNAVSPQPVTNQEFTKTLGKILNRPTFLPMPAFLARLVFGEMADAMFLSSSNVIPKKISESNFSYLYPQLEPALKKLLN